MLDIKFIRENPDLVKKAAEKKHIAVSIDSLLHLDGKRLSLQKDIEVLRAKQNETSLILPEAGLEERTKLLKEMKKVKVSLSEKEEEQKSVILEWRTIMLQVPNVPDVSVPDGESDADNVEVKKVGTIPTFSFEPKNHLELMEALDLADFARGSKVAGFRGYFLKGDAVLLSFALWRFALDKIITKGFKPLLVPSLVRPEGLFGTGYLPGGEEDLYKTQDGDFLAGTAEVATMGYFMDEILEEKDLPMRFASFSPCFRREAGSHGKDTKGIFRVHEFYKLEQVVLVPASHEDSVTWHESLTENAEELLTDLELPYRIVLNCGADLGLGQVKKYDIEVWTPSEKKYRESHSASYFHDFQTRRLNIRYRDKKGELHFVHSLNNTLIATPRIIIALLENHQQKDGTIRVPKGLIPYIGKDFIGR
jgi:seryl-tRNA synthetase